MDNKEIFNDLKFDLQSICFSANERLLKEEQVRSSIFSSLRKQGYFVAAERNYSKNSEIECDLVFWKDGENESWMEIKTSHYSELKDERIFDKNNKASWNNKPSEQFEKWKGDVLKLQSLDSDILKFFVLVEQCNEESCLDKILSEKKLENFQLFQKLEQESCEFELNWKKAPVNRCVVRIFRI